MAEQIIPTKGNLMNARRSLALANTGYDLMERKRKVLVREIAAKTREYRSLLLEAEAAYKNAFYKLKFATIADGLPVTPAQSVPLETSVNIVSRSIMGVEVPLAKIEKSEMRHYYGLTDTSLMLDEAYEEFNRFKELIVELASLETTLFKLDEAVSKTVKRSNALGNIVIPKHTADVKFITASLEEKEREEFTRLKVVKKTDS